MASPLSSSASAPCPDDPRPPLSSCRRSSSSRATRSAPSTSAEATLGTSASRMPATRRPGSASAAGGASLLPMDDDGYTLEMVNVPSTVSPSRLDRARRRSSSTNVTVHDASDPTHIVASAIRSTSRKAESSSVELYMSADATDRCTLTFSDTSTAVCAAVPDTLASQPSVTATSELTELRLRCAVSIVTVMEIVSDGFEGKRDGAGGRAIGAAGGRGEGGESVPGGGCDGEGGRRGGGAKGGGTAGKARHDGNEVPAKRKLRPPRAVLFVTDSYRTEKHPWSWK